MTIQETRLSNLTRIMRTQFGNSQARLAQAIAREANYVNNLIHKRKPFGEKVAREIETELRLAKYSLDREAIEGEDKQADGAKFAVNEPSAVYEPRAPDPDEAARRAAMAELFALTQDMPMANLQELIGDAQRKREQNRRILEDHYAKMKDAA